MTSENNEKKQPTAQRPKYKVKKTPPKKFWEKPTGYYHAKAMGFLEFMASNLHLYGDGDFFTKKD